MHALNALGFALGADAPGVLLADTTTPAAYTLPTSRLTGRMVVPVEGRIENIGGQQVSVTKEVDVTTGEKTEVVTDAGGNVLGAKKVGDFPWLLVLGGVALAGGAYFMMKKKRGGAMAGYSRRRRRRR